MKKRLLLILNAFIVMIYMCSAAGCGQKDSEIGSEGIAINSDGTPKVESDAANSASTQEVVQDPYEYLNPALEILGWQCVNDVAAGKAIELINKAIEIDDSIAEAYKARGSAYMCLGDSIANFDSAEADFVKMQELEPDNPDGYLGQAEILIRKGRKDEAIELLNKAAELMDAQAISAASDAASDNTTEGSSEDNSVGASDSSIVDASNADISSMDSSESEDIDSTTGDSGSEDIDSTTGDSGSDTASDDEFASSKEARYNSGISEIFMTSKEAIWARIDELSLDTYSDSTGRVRYKTIYGEDGTIMESIFYACYLYGEDESNIIVSYNAEGTMLATVFDFFEGTDKYVYGMYTGSDTWNVCVPLWTEDGTMTGIETYYGGSIIAYDIYLYDSENVMIGSEQYNASKSLENTVYFDGYSADNAANGGEGVVGTPSYTIEDVYDLLAGYVE